MSVTNDILPARAPPQGLGASRRGETAVKLILAMLLLAGIAVYATIVDRTVLARYGPRLIGGLGTTLLLVMPAILVGALVAVPVAFARLSRNPLIAGPAYGYVYAFRGTPLLAQLFLVYYGAGEFRRELDAAGLWWLFRDPFWCALMVFTLNTAAYQAEIYRGAIAAVAKGQWEGARALGLHRLAILRFVVLPQAAIIALRPLGNEIIFMIKGSAVASVITVFDLMGETRLAYSRTYNFEIYLWAALLYLGLVEILRRLWDQLEAYLTRHLKRDRADDGALPEPSG